MTQGPSKRPTGLPLIPDPGPDRIRPWTDDPGNIYTPPGGPPPTDRIQVEVYEAMGEDNVMAFSRAFYRRLGASPAADLFPKGEKNLMRAADKSGAMFVFLFGGPHLYQQRHGPPRLRMRHLPFRIDEAARQTWLACLRETLAEAPAEFAMPAQHVGAVDAFLTAFSSWMVNARSDPQEPDQ